jgi:hypothetical protein
VNFSDNAGPTSRPQDLRRILAALALFGVSFGYVEAALVTYLRAIYDPMRRAVHQQSEDELFPLLTIEDLEAAGPQHLQRLVTELVRELATLAMLSAVGIAVARNVLQWFAGFMIAFGVWDIFYYVFLKILIDWPQSLFTWDILFLVPVPWVGPVIAPAFVSLSMIFAGLGIFYREASGQPLGPTWKHWAATCAGGVILILAMTWDFRNTSTGGYPNPFHWPLFLLGEALGLSAFLHAWRTTATRSTK